jgi:sugar/nucleoside kinase (ribokinase family)
MQYRALFIGLTTIDIQYFVDEFPKQNQKVKTDSPELYVGGPATNAAVAFAKLNNGAFLASPTAKNAFLSYIKDDFKSTQISHFNLTKNQSANPVIASVITSLINGDRNIFTNNPDFKQFDFSAEELIEAINPEIIMLDGFFPELAKKVAQIARRKNIPVVIDCGTWKLQYETLLDYCDMVICSSDFYPPGCINSDHVFEYLQNKKVKYIAISRGADSILFISDKRREIQIENTGIIVDTLGAGDFLHGAFCYYFLALNHFEKALIKASELATFTCKFKGTRDWIKLY